MNDAPKDIFADTLEAVPLDWHPCPRCGSEVARKGLCWECERVQMRAEAARDRFKRAFDSLPASYQLSLDAPELERRGVHARIRDRARALLGTRNVVIVGTQSGSGKSSLLGAMMLEWARRNDASAVWVPSYALSGSSMQLDPDWAEAGLVCLDDLGNERQMASSLVLEFLEERYARGRALWVSTSLGRAEMSMRYGMNGSRRVYERAAVLDFGGGR